MAFFAKDFSLFLIAFCASGLLTIYFVGRLFAQSMKDEEPLMNTRFRD
ncbi:MAG: hypothetical protein NTV54_00265 [Ignavibacteriales bacterium]|nr:hypothetical protein [Ignavibacteriales bacterium]